MNEPAHIGREIRTARPEHRWSQHQLASRSRIERGEPNFLARDTLIRLAAALETPMITGAINQWLTPCAITRISRRSGLMPGTNEST